MLPIAIGLFPVGCSAAAVACRIPRFSTCRSTRLDTRDSWGALKTRHAADYSPSQVCPKREALVGPGRLGLLALNYQ